MDKPLSLIADDECLSLLDAERSKFTRRNETIMENLVNELIRRNVYPAKSNIGLSALKMVDGWGAYWHKFSKDPNPCPNCKTDLNDHEHGPPFSLKISIYDRDKDRTVAWKCPFCKQLWNRK